MFKLAIRFNKIKTRLHLFFDGISYYIWNIWPIIGPKWITSMFNKVTKKLIKIKKAIKKLTFEQNINFGFSCINRLKHLPHFFINSENDGINYLDKIYPKEYIENISNDRIKDKINKTSEIFDGINEELEKKYHILFDLFDIDDESTKQDMFFYYVCIMISLYDYIKGKKSKSIYECSEYIIKILDQIKYWKYYKLNKNGTKKEALEYVDREIENEIRKQMEIIKLLKQNDKDILNDYIKNNWIEYNE